MSTHGDSYWLVGYAEILFLYGIISLITKFLNDTRLVAS